MKFFPVQLVLNGSMGASLNTNGVELSSYFTGSIHAIWTGGSAAGSLALQWSNDNVVVLPGSANPSSNVVNWNDYSGTASTVAGAGQFGWILDDNLGYKWLRVVFTRVSGTGSLTVNFMGKG